MLRATDSILPLSLPSRVLNAALAACSPCAEMSDMTLSAFARSMRPFKKARFVNSPGPAG